MNAFDLHSRPQMSSAQLTPPPPRIELAQQVELICAASIDPEPVEWIWEYWLAAGKLHLLAGAPGTGKSTLTAFLAMMIARGYDASGAWPDNSPAPFGKVVVWSVEDGLADTIIPRLRAYGGLLDQVHLVGQTTSNGRVRPFDPAVDIPYLRQAMRHIGDVKLLIMDPIGMVVAGDSNKNADVRKGLAELVELAEELGCAVVGITHVAKASKKASPAERILGSTAFVAVARIVMFVEEIKSEGEQDGPGRYVLYRAKSNIGPRNGGLIYHIGPFSVQTNTGMIATSRIHWHDNQIEGSPDEISKFAQGIGGSGTFDKIGEAITFLRTTLAGGPMGCRNIELLATQAGISKSTLRRAKERLQIVSSKLTGMGSDSPFICSLSPSPDSDWQSAFQYSAFSKASRMRTPEQVGQVGPIGQVAQVAQVGQVGQVGQVRPIGQVGADDEGVSVKSPDDETYVRPRTRAEQRTVDTVDVDPTQLRAYAEECHILFKKPRMANTRNEDGSFDEEEAIDELIDAVLNSKHYAMPHRTEYRNALRATAFWQDTFAPSNPPSNGANRWRS